MRSHTHSLSLAVVLLFALAVPVFGAAGEWKTYTSKRTVRAVVLDSTHVIWAATSGGLFAYRPASYGRPVQLNITTSEGLRTTDLTSIAVDRRNTLWIGAGDGMLHHYDPRQGTWQYVNDITSLNTPQKQINALKVQGDTLYVLTMLGVSVYNLARGEFGDTYMRFGPAGNQLVGDAFALELFNDRIWVATANGIASTPVSNINPSAPESWRVDVAASGLPANNVRGLTAFGGVLYAATANGVGAFDGAQWSTLSGTSGRDVIGVSPSGTVLAPGGIPQVAFLTRSELSTAPPLNGTGTVAVLPAAGTNYTALSPAGLIVGTALTGIVIPGSSPTVGQWEHYLSPGPTTNSFVGMAVDDNGVLWSVTGSQNGEGFLSFDRSVWKSYRVEQYPQLGGNDFFKVSIGANNAKWFGNWGTGVTLVDGSGTIRRVLTVANGLLPTLSFSPSYVVVGGVGTDASGSAWIMNRTPPNDTSLVVFRSDSSFQYVTGQPCRGSDQHDDIVFNDVIIDSYNTKWFTNFTRFEPTTGKGLFFYNESGPLSGMTSSWGKLTTGDGLTSNQIWCLTIGRDGDLWIGTDQGVSIIFNPQSPRSIALYHPLRDQVVQAIVTDPLNNKWCATKQGVFVLSSDGTSLLEHYTKENTDGKLPDNDVASIAIDKTNGTVYFGTEKGLGSITTPGLAPLRSFETLKVIPNPYIVPSTRDLTIDGLVQGSTLKITTISGSLVREIRTPGGRVGYWDGRDMTGAIVPSGVYIIIAASEDGSSTLTGKVAVLRR